MGGSSSTQVSSGFMMNNANLDRKLPILQLTHYEAEVQGRRTSMEDESCAGILDPTHFPHIAMYAVFDGHGGKECAHYARKHLAKHITRQLLGVVDRIATEFGLDPKTGLSLNTSQTASTALPSNVTPSHSTVGGLGRSMSHTGGLNPAVERKDSYTSVPGAGGSPMRTHSYASTVANSTGSAAVVSLDGSPLGSHRSTLSSVHQTYAPSTMWPSMRTFPTPTYSLNHPDAAKLNKLWYRSVNVLQLGAVAVSSAFADCDQAWFQGKGSKLEAGCTAVVVLIDTVNSYLLCLNAGDARAFLSRRGTCVSLTKIHSPSQPMEKARILEASGSVVNGRLNGILAVSRALGDRSFKRAQGATATTTLLEEMQGYPHTKYIPNYDIAETGRNPWTFACSSQPDYAAIGLSAALGDEFVLLACDGLYDVMTETEVIDFIKSKLAQIPCRTTYIGVTTPLICNTDSETFIRTPALHKDLSRCGNHPELAPWPHEYYENAAWVKIEQQYSKALQQLHMQNQFNHQNQKQTQPAILPMSEDVNIATPRRNSSGAVRRPSTHSTPSSGTNVPAAIVGGSSLATVATGSNRGEVTGRSSPRTPTTPDGPDRNDRPGKLGRALSYNDSRNETGTPRSHSPATLQTNCALQQVPLTTSTGMKIHLATPPSSTSQLQSSLNGQLILRSSQGSPARTLTGGAAGKSSRPTTPQAQRTPNHGTPSTPTSLSTNLGPQLPAYLPVSTPTAVNPNQTLQPSTSFSSSSTSGSPHVNLQLSLPTSASRPKYTTYANSTSLLSRGNSFSTMDSPAKTTSAVGATPSPTLRSNAVATSDAALDSAKVGLITPEKLAGKRDATRDLKSMIGERLVQALIPGNCLCGRDLLHGSSGSTREVCEDGRRALIEELGAMPPTLSKFALNAIAHIRGYKMNPLGTPELWSELGQAEYHEYALKPDNPGAAMALASIAQDLCQEALRRGTRDNVSVIIVFLGFPQIPPVHATAVTGKSKP